YSEKYISQTELQADELSVKKKTLDLELAQNDLSLLKNFTHKRKLAQLESDVIQAGMALERTTRKASANVVQSEANLMARESEFERHKAKLKKVEKQIEKTKIRAPADGLVIYATSTQRGGHKGPRIEPLAEGTQVRERQALIHLPTTSGAVAEVGIYEANMDKVSVGLPAVITVDAIPGVTFTGRVASIAPLPNAQSSFMNPDLKIYDTEIFLNENGNTELLRTGMNCNTEIVVEQFKKATYIPLQAVLRVKGKPTVYVIKDNKLEPRTIELGMDNDMVVRVMEGLEPGEVISITPPLVYAAVKESEFKEFPDITPLSEMKAASGTVTRQPPPRGGSFAQRFDRDADGKVSKEEFPGSDEVFSRLDKNGDGFISKGEAPTGPPGGGKGQGKGKGPGSGPPGGGGGPPPGF
ncbi:MAG: efflux RND transporter periplasmic adaptor subunit, partial [Deltaproteobacteria bacterium]|nr:efflux RND transporter periplasmic adaptor subunit [Deltaproteobacteria bacterium]